MTRLGVLEREVDVPARLAPQVRDLARDPDVAELAARPRSAARASARRPTTRAARPRPRRGRRSCRPRGAARASIAAARVPRTRSAPGAARSSRRSSRSASTSACAPTRHGARDAPAPTWTPNTSGAPDGEGVLVGHVVAGVERRRRQPEPRHSARTASPFDGKSCGRTFRTLLPGMSRVPSSAFAASYTARSARRQPRESRSGWRAWSACPRSGRPGTPVERALEAAAASRATGCSTAARDGDGRPSSKPWLPDDRRDEAPTNRCDVAPGASRDHGDGVARGEPREQPPRPRPHARTVRIAHERREHAVVVEREEHLRGRSPDEARERGPVPRVEEVLHAPAAARAGTEHSIGSRRGARPRDEDAPRRASRRRPVAPRFPRERPKRAPR